MWKPICKVNTIPTVRVALWAELQTRDFSPFQAYPGLSFCMYNCAADVIRRNITQCDFQSGFHGCTKRSSVVHIFDAAATTYIVSLVHTVSCTKVYIDNTEIQLPAAYLFNTIKCRKYDCILYYNSDIIDNSY